MGSIVDAGNLKSRENHPKVVPKRNIIAVNCVVIVGPPYYTHILYVEIEIACKKGNTTTMPGTSNEKRNRSIAQILNKRLEIRGPVFILFFFLTLFTSMVMELVLHSKFFGVVVESRAGEAPVEITFPD